MGHSKKCCPIIYVSLSFFFLLLCFACWTISSQIIFIRMQHNNKSCFFFNVLLSLTEPNKRTKNFNNENGISFCEHRIYAKWKGIKAWKLLKSLFENTTTFHCAAKQFIKRIFVLWEKNFSNISFVLSIFCFVYLCSGSKYVFFYAIYWCCCCCFIYFCFSH